MNTHKTMFVLALGLGLSLTLLTVPLFAATGVVPLSDADPIVASPSVISTTQLSPSQDNTLYEILDGSLSNGAGEYFFVGKTQNGPFRRGLIQFDVAGGLPAGAIIVSATLQLTVSMTPIGGPAGLVTLHRATSSWGEGTSNALEPGGRGITATLTDATWLHRFYSSTLWTNAGGDFVITASAATIVGSAGPYAWSSPQLLADAQHWLDVPASNHGWIVIGDESTPQTARRFNTRENLSANTRPALSITWFTPSSQIYLPFISRQ